MINIKKIINLHIRVISIIVAVFLFNGALYGFDFSIRKPLSANLEKDKARLEDAIIWGGLDKFSVKESYESYEEFTEMLSHKILASQTIKGRRMHFVVVDGTSGVGKSYLCGKIAEEIKQKGGKCVVIQRDWFIGQRDGKRFYDKERIRRLLEDIKRIGNEEESQEVSFKEERLHGVGSVELKIDKETIVIVDGARELEDMLDFFDIKILLAVEDLELTTERKIERERGKGVPEEKLMKEREKEKKGISYWTAKFGHEVDLVIKMDDIERPQIFLPLNKGVINVRKEGKAGDRIIIEHLGPDKKFAMEDYIRSNGFNAEDGIYIGNETKPNNKDVDHVLVEIDGLSVFAVDKEAADNKGIAVDDRAVYVGKGPDGTGIILRRLIELLNGATPDETSSIDNALVKLLDRSKKHFIALDIDGTILDYTIAGIKEDLIKDRSDILDCLIYLIQNGFYIAFMTKNNEANTWERIGKHLSERITEDEKRARVTAYTSASVKKMVLSTDRFEYAQGSYGRYQMWTMIPENVRKTIRLVLEKLISETEYKDNIKIEERGEDNNGNISQFRLVLQGVPETEVDELLNKIDGAISGLTKLIMRLNLEEDLRATDYNLNEEILESLIELQRGV